MSRFSVLFRIKSVIDKVVDITVITLFVVMISFTFLQVVGRYIFLYAPPWTEELARYISIWIVFLGASIGFRTSSHLGVDFFVELLPEAPKKFVFIIINLLLIGMLLTLMYQGIKMFRFAFGQVTAVTRISMSYIYAAVPVGALLMVFEVIVNSIKKDLIDN
jgi:TRAP-type C4-dicarboxylate transport system permease small subunit